MKKFRVYYAYFDHTHDCVDSNHMDCEGRTREDAKEDFKLSMGENYNNYPIVYIKDLGEWQE